MENLWRSVSGQDPSPEEYQNIEFWSNPERSGWLTKQTDYLKTWRRRWFVLKQGKLLWFKDPSSVHRSTIPRGVISVGSCVTVKGAEDVLNKPYAFELSNSNSTMYFIADSDKEKEDWINSIGRSIVQHSSPGPWVFMVERISSTEDTQNYMHTEVEGRTSLLLAFVDCEDGISFGISQSLNV
ncbi:hypothetical protein ACFE04_015632 [Oxalis oulophora]